MPTPPQQQVEAAGTPTRLLRYVKVLNKAHNTVTQNDSIQHSTRLTHAAYCRSLRVTLELAIPVDFATECRSAQVKKKITLSHEVPGSA